MKKLLVVLSLMLISLSGCYIRGQDDGYRKDRDHREDNRGHYDRNGDHGDEHGDRDKQH